MNTEILIKFFLEFIHLQTILNFAYFFRFQGAVYTVNRKRNNSQFACLWLATFRQGWLFFNHKCKYDNQRNIICNQGWLKFGLYSIPGLHGHWHEPTCDVSGASPCDKKSSSWSFLMLLQSSNWLNRWDFWSKKLFFCSYSFILLCKS